ncbi:hypothetical protein FZEAL_10719 [Fusarium zealandicum]|uniref:Gpi anchored serine-threonine rich protein n=1 Tax=Fusarium zealandicum TaxID=1053134 RepID=A0A8H4X9G5_9HYPO|nr:hypothetical protein FZEAL_10719 [Fusarium zealandicum]
MNKVFLFVLSASGPVAALRGPLLARSPLLAERQVITIPCEEQGLKDCGSGCIQQDWTCCPSRAGGCPPTAFCDVGTNGQYGCCPTGSVCDGNGGANTRGSTNTVTLRGTNTLLDGATATAEPQAPLEPSSTVEEPEATLAEPQPEASSEPDNTNVGGAGVGGIATGGGSAPANTNPIIPAPANTDNVVPPVVPNTPDAQPTLPAGTPVPLPGPGTPVNTPGPVVVNAAPSTALGNWIGGVLAGIAALLI